VFTNNANSVGAGAATSIVVPTLSCPSDGLGPVVKTSVWGTFCKSNYLAFFGNEDYHSAHPPLGPTHKRAIFGFNRSTRLKEVVDGTSHTMMLGEYLVGTDGESDFRGAFWSDQPGYGQLYTKLGPNSVEPDVMYPSEGSYPTYCFNRPELNLPCVSSGNHTGIGHTVAARSRHSGTVGVLIADGSVRHVDDQIALDLWQALGSMDSHEIAQFPE
jgi:hypothetical protein